MALEWTPIASAIVSAIPNALKHLKRKQKVEPTAVFKSNDPKYPYELTGPLSFILSTAFKSTTEEILTRMKEVEETISRKKKGRS
jgi:hypothetical protein